MSLESFGEEPIYNFERIGSFGRFYSGQSFPIEYIVTTFAAAELSELTFARDIRPDKIDFELLMQRDIDEERVRLEMEPYLNPSFKQITVAEIKTRSVFFPPLLAAIVPTKGKVMEAYYTDEQGDIALQPTGKEYIIREWPGLFKLTYFSSNTPHAYHLPLKMLDDTVTEIGVQREPVKMEIRLAKGNQYGAKLIIIDGQHRLFTLKQVYEKNPELLEQLGVPVCILFAPNATVQKNREYSPYRVPTVPEVFRNLFVDVNNTAKQVGGHFNILLSDNSISNLACRKFCDWILKHQGVEGLAVIEWNTKAKKESCKITRPYSLTSIGIIDKALEESIGNRKSLLKYLLNLDEVNEELYPLGEDEEAIFDYPTVQWNKFSLTQKNILEKQVRKYLIPCLEMIFFSTYEFSRAFNVFNSELGKLKELAASDQPEAFEARQVINQIVDYIPIGDGKVFESVRLIQRDFELAVKREREQQVSPIIQYALFQRAIFETWAQLLEVTRIFNVDPRGVTGGLVRLLDLALQDQGQFFQFDRLYMQHTVFYGTQIIVREETRKILSQLLLIQLANSANVQQVVDEIGVTGKEVKKLTNKLQEKGKMVAAEFPKYYELARKRSFKANYRVYLSITGEEREELAYAEDEQKRHLKEVKEGKRNKTEVSERFDLLVDKHVKSDIELAMRALQSELDASEFVVLEEMNGLVN
jgi:DNA-binding MarR family transcriptional regulator